MNNGLNTSRWSQRTAWEPAGTPWAQYLARIRAEGGELWDLTASNPTECGLVYSESLLAPLAHPRALVYDPDPRGMRTAREAVARYYRDHGANVDPERIFLTTGTSEAYSFLFRLICNPGDEVLVAQPSYPLLDVLAQLEDVRLIPYELFYDHGWHLDVEAIRRRIGCKTKALVVVHPNNPTGHFTSAEERQALDELCRGHGLALVIDEVFLDYPLANSGKSFAVGDHTVPAFVVSGLSKIAGLPQMKAGWIVCLGDVAVDTALERLEVIADTFLSQNAPVQCALPHWLQGRFEMQRQIGARVRRNLEGLDRELAKQSMVSRLSVDAGWHAVLRVPALQSAEERALDLLLRLRVAVHSGNFFGFRGEGWMVVSLLQREAEFRSGIEVILNDYNAMHDEPKK